MDSLAIYFFIYLLTYFSLSLTYLTFILPIYHFLYLLSQSVLYYLLCIHFGHSLLPNLLLLKLQYHRLFSIYVCTYLLIPHYK